MKKFRHLSRVLGCVFIFSFMFSILQAQDLKPIRIRLFDGDFMAPLVLAFPKVPVTAVVFVPFVLQLRFLGDKKITMVRLEVLDERSHA